MRPLDARCATQKLYACKVKAKRTCATVFSERLVSLSAEAGKLELLTREIQLWQLGNYYSCIDSVLRGWRFPFNCTSTLSQDFNDGRSTYYTCMHLHVYQAIHKSAMLKLQILLPCWNHNIVSARSSFEYCYDSTDLPDMYRDALHFSCGRSARSTSETCALVHLDHQDILGFDALVFLDSRQSRTHSAFSYDDGHIYSSRLSGNPDGSLFEFTPPTKIYDLIDTQSL